MKYLPLAVASLILIFLCKVARAEVSVSGPRSNKIEDLIIWKFSDELKLSAIEERKFVKFFQELSAKKSKLEKKNSELIEKLKEVKTKAELEKSLKAFKKNASLIEHLSIEEVEQIEKLFGAEKARQYLVLKFDINRKLRELSVSTKSNEGDKKVLPPPKIIEE